MKNLKGFHSNWNNWVFFFFPKQLRVYLYNKHVPINIKQ